MNFVLRSLIILSVIVIMDSCKTTTRLSNRNLNFLYQEPVAELKPKYSVFHHSQDSSTIYYKIRTDQLLYTKESEELPYEANYKIQYKLFDSYSTRIITDSLTMVFSDTDMYESGQEIIDSMIVSIPHGEKYIMHVKMTDNNGQVKHTNVLRANKTGDNNLQYYKVYGESGRMRFSPMISNSETIYLRHASDISADVNVSIFAKPQPLAIPPYVDDDMSIPSMEPDTVFQITFSEGKAVLPIEVNGFYRLHHDHEPGEGASLYFFQKGYPYIVDAKQMLPPLRYLATNEEFQKLIEHPDTTDAVDIFWTTMAGTPLRGRNVVESYYNNVQIANKHFTSFKEGWKTDRGMIYSVYGHPGYVVRSDDMERWTYEEAWGIPETTFVFRAIEAPAGETCYKLVRDPGFRSSWFQTVEKIRR